MGPLGRDSPLEQEPAIGRVENNFSRCGGAEPAGQDSVGVGDDTNRATQKSSRSEDGLAALSIAPRLRSVAGFPIQSLGSIDHQGDLDRSVTGVENLVELLESSVSATALRMDEDQQKRISRTANS
jgi:hypothetical protein